MFSLVLKLLGWFIVALDSVIESRDRGIEKHGQAAYDETEKLYNIQSSHEADRQALLQRQAEERDRHSRRGEELVTKQQDRIDAARAKQDKALLEQAAAMAIRTGLRALLSKC